MKRRFGAARPARRLRRQSHWAVMLGTALAASTTAGIQPAAAASTEGASQGAQASGAASTDSRQLQFQIAAGPLDAAVAEFQRVTGLKVVFVDPRIGSIQSSAAVGTLTPAAAMDAMLSGTAVRATFGPDGVRLDIRGVSEFVAVEGQPTKVAGPKYSQTLRDTPVTVSVIPQQVYQEQNATSLREVLRNTPGITMSIGEGGSGGTSSGDNVLIRGFSARNDIYVDGARDVGLISRDAFNTEVVEVAKGPSSVTTGRGSTGGSINLVTKTANLQDSASARLTAGNAGYKRSTIDVNRKVSDTVAVRFNGMWQDAGVPGRDEVTQKGWGVAPSIGFGLGTETSLTLNYNHLHQNNLPDYGLPGTLPDLAVAAGKTIDDIDFSNFYGLVSRDHENITSDVATATVEHRFGRAFSLRNLTRYGKNNLDRVVTPPRAASLANGGLDPGFNPALPQIRRTDTRYQYRDDTTITNQTDATVGFQTAGIGHSAVAGIEVA